MAGPCCDARYDDFFDARRAERDLAAYRRKGASATTRRLIDVLAGDGIAGLSVLDIGAGVGAVHEALLAAGAASAVDVDASRPYLAAARAEAERRGVADRVRFEHGDLTRIAERVAPADLVALDRVVCCHPDVAGLVGAAARRTRLRLGLVLPRDRAWIRLAVAVFNVFDRVRRRPLPIYLHPYAAVGAAASDAGLVPLVSRPLGPFWQLLAYERPAAQAGG